MWAVEPGDVCSHPSLIMAGYVTLGKLFNLIMPHFPQLYNGNRLLRGLNTIMCIKHLEQGLDKSTILAFAIITITSNSSNS